MYVYVVEENICYEGSTVWKVFSTHEAAMQYAERQAKQTLRRDGGDEVRKIVMKMTTGRLGRGYSTYRDNQWDIAWIVTRHKVD